MMFQIFTREGFISFLYFLPALLISLSVHEFGHAYVAYKLGDKSQKALGRLTLAPFAHIDWMGFLSIILIGIGWGKPVMVDDRNFKKRGRDNMLVSIAGAVSNIILAIVILAILKLLMVFGALTSILATHTGLVIFQMLLLTIGFNFVFAAFNMIPLPPFDGSKALYYFLPYKLKGIMTFLEKYALFLFIILIVSDAYMYVVEPAYKLAEYLINIVLGI